MRLTHHRENARASAAQNKFAEAIRFYLAALNETPDDVELHGELRQLALRRKAAGGQGMGLIERLRERGLSRDPKRRLIAAAKLLAYDPGDGGAMMDAAKAANEGGFERAAGWYLELEKRAAIGEH